MERKKRVSLPLSDEKDGEPERVIEKGREEMEHCRRRSIENAHVTCSQRTTNNTNVINRSIYLLVYAYIFRVKIAF